MSADRTANSKDLLARVTVDRITSKRGTVTFSVGTRMVLLTTVDPGYAVIPITSDDRSEHVTNALRLDRAGLVEYAAVLLAAAAELPKEKL